MLVHLASKWSLGVSASAFPAMRAPGLLPLGEGYGQQRRLNRVTCGASDGGRRHSVLQSETPEPRQLRPKRAAEWSLVPRQEHTGAPVARVGLQTEPGFLSWHRSTPPVNMRRCEAAGHAQTPCRRLIPFALAIDPESGRMISGEDIRAGMLASPLLLEE